jgi:D-alanyl-D-alanine carboxypeptidase
MTARFTCLSLLVATTAILSGCSGTDSNHDGVPDGTPWGGSGGVLLSKQDAPGGGDTSGGVQAEESRRRHRGDYELDAKGIAEIEAAADRAVAAGIPGVTLAIQRGKQKLAIARGVSDRATAAPISPDHRVRMASVAKSFVASVVLQLVDEKKLALDDTLGQWLPGALPASSEVTIELLLRQESGLFDFSWDERWLAPYIGGDLGHYWSPQELLGFAADHPPQFTPRAQFQYSNTNYTALAMIIEKITGDTLAKAVRQRITEPLGMTATTFETGSTIPSPFAHGYLVGQGEPFDITAFSGSAIFGCGNLVSTPTEIARFYEALVAGKIVKKKQLRAMFAKDPLVPSTPYAMGVFRFDHAPHYMSCDDFIGHDGGTPGYDSAAYSSVDGKRQFSVVVTSFTADEKAGTPAAHQAYSDLVQAAACR